MWDTDTILLVGSLLILFGAFLFFVVRAMFRTGQGVREFFSAPPVPKESEPPGNAIIESPLVQWVGALLMAGAGIFGTMWVWHKGLKDRDDLGAGFFFPFACVLGLSGLLFPLDFDAQRRKYGRAKPRTWAELPAAMKVAFVLGLLAGAGNVMLLIMRGQ